LTQGWIWLVPAGWRGVACDDGGSGGWRDGDVPAGGLSTLCCSCHIYCKQAVKTALNVRGLAALFDDWIGGGWWVEEVGDELRGVWGEDVPMSVWRISVGLAHQRRGAAVSGCGCRWGTRGVVVGWWWSFNNFALIMLSALVAHLDGGSRAAARQTTCELRWRWWRCGGAVSGVSASVSIDIGWMPPGGLGWVLGAEPPTRGVVVEWCWRIKISALVMLSALVRQGTAAPSERVGWWRGAAGCERVREGGWIGALSTRSGVVNSCYL